MLEINSNRALTEMGALCNVMLHVFDAAISASCFVCLRASIVMTSSMVMRVRAASVQQMLGSVGDNGVVYCRAVCCQAMCKQTL